MSAGEVTVLLPFPLSFIFSFYKYENNDFRVGPKMAEEYDGETTFSLTNSSKYHLNAEQFKPNNF